MASKFTWDEEKALTLVTTLHTAYRLHTHLFKKVHALNGDAPQHKYLPVGVEKGSPEHLLFLFFATMLTYRSLSENGFKQAVTLYEKYPVLFTESVCTIAKKELYDAFKDVGFVHPSQVAKNWPRVADELFRSYHGDPLSIFTKGVTIDGVLKFKKGPKGTMLFPGFGPKLFSLLAIFYEELGATPHIHGAFPVDLHVQRIFISLNVVTGTGVQDAAKVAEFIRKRLSELCYKLGIKPLDLSHALWFLGNRVCAKCDKVKEITRTCPLEVLCSGGIPSGSYGETGRWDFDAPRKNKGHPFYQAHQMCLEL